jgi:hypothetical protein
VSIKKHVFRHVAEHERFFGTFALLLQSEVQVLSEIDGYNLHNYS